MKKSIFLIILVLAFLTIFISCFNENSPSNLNINKEDSLDSDKKDISNNSNEEKLDNDTENNPSSTSKDSLKDMFITDIPYDRSIKYTTNINANSAIGANVIADENYIYYINIKDKYKLYRISKDGKNKTSIYGERVDKLQYFNGKIYFLNSEKFKEDQTDVYIYDSYVCSIDKDGNNFVEIIKDADIRNFIAIKDKIYYIAYSGLGEGYNLPSGQYDLFCYDTKSKEKSTIYEIIQIGDLPGFDSSLISNGDNIYFETMYDGIVEYNIETNTSRVILSKNNEYYTSISGLMIYDNELIFNYIDNINLSDEKEEICMINLRKSAENLLSLFSEIGKIGRVLCSNTNNNYVFFAYTLYEEIESGRSKITIVRAKHDGSEAIKIKELFCRQIYHLPVGEIFLVDDKVIFFNSYYWDDEIEEMIKVMDFDGNELGWDI